MTGEGEIRLHPGLISIYVLYSVRDQIVRWVGQAKTPEARLMQHWNTAKSGSCNRRIGAWILEVGQEDLRMKVLEWTPEEHADEREQHFIDFFGKDSILLNAIPVR